MKTGINKNNVGRIAERIVSNELEFRGYRVSDLNKESTAANADLLAAKDGRTWQIQVKGATEENGWWFNYSYCDESIISKKKPVFNRHEGFYKAEIVVLVCVKSPSEYCCIVLESVLAEKLAQMHLDYAFRRKKKDGSPLKPGKMWSALEHVPKTKDEAKRKLMEEEQKILQAHRDKWDIENFPSD